MEDRPKLLGDRIAVAERLRQLHEPHVAPLTRFVEALRSEVGCEAVIPYFDPWDGGVGARVLMLLEAPGRQACNSGFISRNNPDQTAKNIFELCGLAEIDRKATVLWNAVPWYIGDGKKIRAAGGTDLASSLQYLPRLLNLLPALQAVVLLGGKAQKFDLVCRRYVGAHCRVFKCPHPSPLFVNRAPGNRGKILDELRGVADHLAQVEH